MTYKLSDTKLLKRTKHYFKITAKNNYGTSTKYYVIGTNGTRYIVNSSPRLNIQGVSTDNKIRYSVIDANKLEYVKIYDMKNNNKLIATKNNFTSTKQFEILNLDNYKKDSNGNYKLKFEIKDSSGQVSSKVVAFKLTTKISAPNVVIKKFYEYDYDDYIGYRFTYNIKGATKIKVRIKGLDRIKTNNVLDRYVSKPQSDSGTYFYLGKELVEEELGNKVIFEIVAYYDDLQSEVQTVTVY